jgi:hypothetical protein
LLAEGLGAGWQFHPGRGRADRRQAPGFQDRVSQLRLNPERPRFSAVITLEISGWEGTEDFNRLATNPPLTFEGVKVEKDPQGKPRSVELLSNPQLPLAHNEKVWLYIDEPGP